MERSSLITLCTETERFTISYYQSKITFFRLLISLAKMVNRTKASLALVCYSTKEPIFNIFWHSTLHGRFFGPKLALSGCCFFEEMWIELAAIKITSSTFHSFYLWGVSFINCCHGFGLRSIWAISLPGFTVYGCCSFRADLVRTFIVMDMTTFVWWYASKPARVHLCIPFLKVRTFHHPHLRVRLSQLHKSNLLSIFQDIFLKWIPRQGWRGSRFWVFT